MSKEIESGLARRIAGKKAEKRVLGKAWMAVVLGAVLLVGSAAAAAASESRNGNEHAYDMDGEPARDGSCEELVADLDCVCDCPVDCTCPCCDGTV